MTLYVLAALFLLGILGLWLDWRRKRGKKRPYRQTYQGIPPGPGGLP